MQMQKIDKAEGPAYSFYRSCIIEKWSNYMLLIEQLVRQFIPIQIKANFSKKDNRSTVKPWMNI